MLGNKNDPKPSLYGEKRNNLGKELKILISITYKENIQTRHLFYKNTR